MRSGSSRAGQDRSRGQRHLVPAPAALIQRPALMAPVPGMLASGANEPVRPTPTKQRLRALLLGPVLVQKLHETVALLKLHPITRHGRLPIFQLLGTIRVRLAHWMSLVRNQEHDYVPSSGWAAGFLGARAPRMSRSCDRAVSGCMARERPDAAPPPPLRMAVAGQRAIPATWPDPEPVGCSARARSGGGSLREMPRS